MGLATRSDFAARRRGKSLLALAALSMPLFLFVVLRSFPGLDKVFMSANFHVVVVSAIAACAVGIALIAGVAAGRSRDSALVFVALGGLALGMIMLAHGLVTPGVAGVEANPWVGRLPNFAIAAFALTQLLAVLPVTRRVALTVARHPWLSLTVPTLILTLALGSLVISTRNGSPAPTAADQAAATVPVPASEIADDAYGAGGSYGKDNSYGTEAEPGGTDPHPQTGTAPSAQSDEQAPVGPSSTENTMLDLLRLMAGAVLVGVGFVHWRRWHLSNDGVVLALALASWLGAEALLSLRFGAVWRISWWDYHILLLLGFGSAVYAVVAGFLRTREGDSLRHAFRHDPLDHIARGYPEALLTLVAAVEARDSYTSGHSRRVTQTAAAIGQRLGLPADELRRLVWEPSCTTSARSGFPTTSSRSRAPSPPRNGSWSRNTQ